MTASADIDLGSCPEINPLYLLRWEDTQDSYVLLYPEGVVKLNETAGEILKRCTGESTIDALIQHLQCVFDGPHESVRAGVYKFLEVSYAKGWLRNRT
jgi:pyrroloquinoline quinone biosynthesis protein D